MAERRPPVAHSEALSTAPSPSTEDPASLLTPTSDVPLIMTPSDAADLSAQSTSTGHSTTDDLTLTLALVKQFTNLVHRAPFLAPAAALTYEILKAYHDTNEPRDVLPVTITDLARNLCGTILRLEATNHFDLLGRLEADVETYTVLLTKASAFIQNYNDQGIMSHVAARNALETKFTTLTRELNSFGARFRNNRLVDLAMNQNVDAQTLDKVHTMVSVASFSHSLNLSR
ncbi:hypothetical protein FB451DRAFT_1292747 [Mycena latifolia]|nr:hypothetical protein FB451DRAFT_1292747 [Mycena latifolia]